VTAFFHSIREKCGLYERVGTTYTKVADVAAPTTTCTIANGVPGVHNYAVTAKNLWGESGYSNEVSTPPAASAPKGLRFSIAAAALAALALLALARKWSR
jgi:hypothetical protein